MTVGIPEISNSSWQLRYKKDDDAIERFKRGETIPNKDEKKPKGEKKPKQTESPKFNRGLPSDEANEAMWKESKEESRLRDAEEKHQKTLKEVKDTDPKKVRSAQNDYRMQQLKERTDAKRQGKEGEHSHYDTHTTRRATTPRETTTGDAGRRASISEENIGRQQSKIQQERGQHKQAERKERDTQRLAEERRTQPRTDTRANPVAGGKEIDAKGDSSKKLAEHSRDIDRQRAQAKQRHEAQYPSKKEKPKIDARTARSAVPKTEAESKRRGRQEWDKLPKEAKVPKGHVVTGDYRAPSVPKVDAHDPDEVASRNRPLDPSESRMKSIQVLKTLIGNTKLRLQLRKAKEVEPLGAQGDIKERLQSPTGGSDRDPSKHQTNAQRQAYKDPSKLPKKFIPRKEGGFRVESTATIPKRLPTDSTTIPKADKEGKIPKDSKYKPKDPIGTSEDRIREIRANIRQRKTIKEKERNTRDPKTGKDIKEKVPTWETGVADKEREADDRRFTGEKLDSPQDLKGKKGKEVYEKLEGQGRDRPERSGKTEEEKEAGREKRIQQYRETERKQQESSDAFERGLTGGAKAKYKKGTKEQREAMFKKWKKSQARKKKSNDIAEKLSSLNL